MTRGLIWMVCGAFGIGACAEDVSAGREDGVTASDGADTSVALETAVEFESEVEVETESEVEFETEVEVEVEVEPEVEVEVEPEVEVETESEVEFETESEVEFDTETESEVEFDTETESEVDSTLPPLDASPDVAPIPNTRSLVFDGVDDLVQVANASGAIAQSGLTVEAWIKPASTGAVQHIIAKVGAGGSPEYALRRTANGLAEVVVGLGNGTSCIAYGGSLPEAVWSHVALTWQTILKYPHLFVNGVSVAMSGCSTDIAHDAGGLLIGAALENGVPGHRFAGAIDEVRIWDYARSEAELASTMAHTIAGAPLGLVAYWNFEDGSGDIASELAGGASDGQLGEVEGVDGADPTWSSETPF